MQRQNPESHLGSFASSQLEHYVVLSHRTPAGVASFLRLSCRRGEPGYGWGAPSTNHFAQKDSQTSRHRGPAVCESREALVHRRGAPAELACKRPPHTRYRWTRGTPPESSSQQARPGISVVITRPPLALHIASEMLRRDFRSKGADKAVIEGGRQFRPPLLPPPPLFPGVAPYFATLAD